MMYKARIRVSAPDVAPETLEVLLDLPRAYHPQTDEEALREQLTHDPKLNFSDELRIDILEVRRCFSTFVYRGRR